MLTSSKSIALILSWGMRSELRVVWSKRQCAEQPDFTFRIASARALGTHCSVNNFSKITSLPLDGFRDASRDEPLPAVVNKLLVAKSLVLVRAPLVKTRFMTSPNLYDEYK